MSNAKQQLKSLLESKGKVQYLDLAWNLVMNAAGEIQPELVLGTLFSPEGVQALLPILEMYESEIESEFKLEERIQEESNSRLVVFDDEVLDEVDGYAIVYSDRIEFVANVNGFGDKLPRKNRKYVGSQGDRRWTFPVDMLAEIKPFASFVLKEDGSLVK